MSEHKQDFEAFLGESFRSYMKEMAHNSSWGDELTLARATCICPLHLHAAPAYCVTMHTDRSGWKRLCVSLLCKLDNPCCYDSWLPVLTIPESHILLVVARRNMIVTWAAHCALACRTGSTAAFWFRPLLNIGKHIVHMKLFICWSDVMRLNCSNVFCRGLCVRPMALSSMSSPVTSRTGSCDMRLRCSQRTTWKYSSHTLRPYTTTLSGVCST